MDKSANSSESNVKVVVRIRPQNERESGERDVVNCVSDQVLVFDPADDVCEFNGQRTSTFVRGDITRKRRKNMNFAFDYVFGPDSINVDLYEHTSKSILDGLLNGYNCSVFAYGATGAGKTYTMLGTSNQPGITFLTLMDLYQRIEALRATKKCEVAVSYLEIYNEQIKDLLTNKGNLQIREDPKTGIVIPGLSLQKPSGEKSLLTMLYNGNKNRTQHATDANAESSRSHAVFQVYVKQYERTANMVTSIHVAKLCLVDLAGSERGTVTRNSGARMREGANINRSLLALGNVINMLADNKVKAHIPYRDSKLTRLLKDSIGGNCRTVMIAAVSPSATSYEDTYNTLKYADRAKHIRADLKKNIMNVTSHISKYGEIIASLRKEVTELKEKVANQESNESVKVMSMPQLQSIEESKRLQEVLYNIFTGRKTVRKEMLENESSLRMTEWKVLTKNQSLNKVDWVYDWNSLECQSKKEKGKRVIEISQKRIKSMKEKIVISEKTFANNEEQLQRWKAEKDILESGETPQSLELSLRAHHLEVELADSQRHVKHLKKVISLQDRDSRMKDKAIHNTVDTVKRFYTTLKTNGHLSTELQQQYDQMSEHILGDKEIMWADQNPGDDSSNVDGITLDNIIDFPVLNCVSLSKSLDNNVKKRRESLTPILSKTKSFLNATGDANMDCSIKEGSCTPTASKGTPLRATNTFTRHTMATSLSNPDVLRLKAESEVPSKSLSMSDREFDLKCENTPKKMTFSPCVKSESLSLGQMPKRDKNGSVGRTLFEDDCVLEESVTSPSVEKKVEPTPLTPKENRINNGPSLQFQSPANLPSTRTEAHLLSVGGGTITKSEPSLKSALLPVCKVKPVVPSPAAKENIKALHRRGLPSMFDRKPSTGVKKPLSQMLAARPRFGTVSRINSRLLSRSTTLSTSSTTLSMSSTAQDDSANKKPRRELFRSKSSADIRMKPK